MDGKEYMGLLLEVATPSPPVGYADTRSIYYINFNTEQTLVLARLHNFDHQIN